MALSEEVRSGDRRRALVALRDELAPAIEAADVNVKAQLASQLRATLVELESLGKRGGRRR